MTAIARAVPARNGISDDSAPRLSTAVHDREWWTEEAVRAGTDRSGLVAAAVEMMVAAGMVEQPQPETITPWDAPSWREAAADYHEARAGRPLIVETEPRGKLVTDHNHVSGKAWNDGLITARDLQSKTFKPVRIILPGLIPEGVTLLAGKPKVGKSWLALDVCLAVADETRFVLGSMRPVHGAVLYLALEDNERRLKKRIDKIVQEGQEKWPELLSIHTEWKRIDQGGLEDIEAWIKSAIEKGIEPRLIWIDTLAKIRPIAGRSEQAYAADYRAIDGVQKLAGQCGVGVVFNTHLRKAPSEDDPFDEVSGTLGLTAAADTTIVMKRHSGMVKVYVRGRDIEEAEFAAEFDRNTCRWRIVGGAEDVFRSQERQAIISALKDAKDKDGNRAPLSVSEIMAATERTDRHPVDQMLSKMRKAGEVVVAGRGLYTLPDPDPLNPGEIDEKAAPDGLDEAEVIESAEVSALDKSHRKSHRDLTGAESGEIAGEIAEPSKPLTDNGQSSGSHHHTDLTGIEHGVTEDIPDYLDRTKGNGPSTWRRPRLVPPDRRPALGPEGDSLDDLEAPFGGSAA